MLFPQCLWKLVSSPASAIRGRPSHINHHHYLDGICLIVFSVTVVLCCIIILRWSLNLVLYTVLDLNLQRATCICLPSANGTGEDKPTHLAATPAS